MCLRAPFGFDGGVCVLVVLVSDHCILFYFLSLREEIIKLAFWSASRFLMPSLSHHKQERIRPMMNQK